MNRKYTARILIVTTLATLATLASAQVLGGAASAAGRVSAPVVRPPSPPPPPPVSASSSAAAASSAALRAPSVPAKTSAAGSGAANGDASPTKGVNANATSNASAKGQARGLTVAEAASQQNSLAFSSAETVHAIRSATYATRDSVTADVQTHLEASTNEVAALRVKAEASGEKTRNDFAKAMIALHDREKEVRASLKASVKAGSEKTWGEAQSALAHDYAAYAQAMAEAHAAAQGSADVSDKPKS